MVNVKQVPAVEIHDENARIVKGWGTVDVFDKVNERLPIEEFKRLMPVIMKRGGIVMNRHTNQPAGRILNYQFLMKETSDGPKEGVYLTTEVFKDFVSDDEIWEAIKKEEIEGFSFGGRNNLEDIEFSKGVSRKTLKGLEGFEFSYVPKGMNQEATIEEVNFIAKQELKKEDGETSQDAEHYHLYQIDENGNGKTLGTLPRDQEDHAHEIEGQVVQETNDHNHRLIRVLVEKQQVMKPFAGFEDFAACERANQDKDDPAAFCGFLQARVEKIEQEYNNEKKKNPKKADHFDDKPLSKSDSTLDTDGKKDESFIKNNNLSKDMGDEETNKSGTKKIEDVPQAPSPQAPAEESVVDPMAQIEAKLDTLIGLMTSNTNKVDDEDKPKDEDEDEDSKKALHRKELDKEGDGEKVKLPETEGEEISQDPPAQGAGTDEAEANFLEKEGLAKIKADVKADVLKELLNEKANTPRPGAKVNKNNIQKSEESPAPNTWIDANKMIKKMGLH